MRVVVAGAGVAGLEALMALATDDFELTLLAPERDFVYRPLSGAGGFARAAHYRWPLADFAEHAHASLVHDAVAFVDDEQRTLLTHDGDWISYDALVLAVGARTAPALQAGIAWDRDTDHGALEALLRGIERGARRVAYVVPPGPGWPIPAYELALASAVTARADGVELEAVLLTAERAPLALFGRQASELVAAELVRAGVRVRSAVEVSAERVGKRIALTLAPGEEELEVDELVALPRVRGPRIPGLPADRLGFHPTDVRGRVAGLEAVWAAGDATDLVIKHSSLATQQADAVASAIPGGTEESPPRLRGIVADDARGRWEAEELAGPHPAGARTRHSLWWPPTLAAGQHFGAYLARREPGVRIGAPSYPNGIAVDVEPPRLAQDARPPVRPSERARSALRHDAQERKLESIRRLERAGTAEERALERELADFDKRRAEVVASLAHAGYLHRR